MSTFKPSDDQSVLMACTIHYTEVMEKGKKRQHQILHKLHYLAYHTQHW